MMALFFLAPVRAEIFQNIVPGQKLGEIKKIFPNARFERVKAAWVTENDGFYQMSGPGFSGTLYLAFSDPRPAFRSLLKIDEDELKKYEGLEKSDSNDKHIEEIKLLMQFWDGRIKKTDDEVLTIKWLRWVPDSMIPLQRYISKYGKPEKEGFRDDNMQPYRLWAKRGVTAALTDDEKNVVSVEFEFTKEEKALYCKMRGPAAEFCF